MNKRTHIDVKVSVESIRSGLRKIIGSNNSRLITDVIIGNLNQTECGLEQLIQAMSGIESIFKYKIGDSVDVDMSSLATWRFNKSKTIDAYKIKDNAMKCIIIGVEPYQKACYKVGYRAIKDNDEVIEIEDSVYPNYIIGSDEWPGDLPF